MQAVWPELRPYADEHARDAARRLGLPHTVAGLARLVPAVRFAALATALVRWARDR